MEFLLLDLALAFAALLGYRVLQEVARRGFALVRLDSSAPRRATTPVKLYRRRAQRKAISREAVGAPPPRVPVPCAQGFRVAPHRLINFW